MVSALAADADQPTEIPEQTPFADSADAGPDRRRVVVLNGYSRHNTGDWLLFEESLALARAAHPGAVVQGIALDPESFEGRTHADEILPSPVRPGHLVSGVLEAFVALVTGGRRGAPAFRALRGARAAYSVGGGFIQFRSPRELVTVGLVHGLQWLMARRVGVRVTMLPQSIGPFEGRLQRAAARWLLGGFDRVIVRDQISIDRVRQLSEDISARTELVPDLVFYEPREARPPNGRARRLGIVVRNWWFPGSASPMDDQRRYLEQVAAAVDQLIDAGWEAEIVVHSDGPTDRGDDRIATRQLQGLMRHDVGVVDVCEAPTPEAAAGHYAQYELVIAVRMHAALLALREGTAALAIAYETKTDEIFGQLGIGEWAQPIEGLTADRLLEVARRPFPHEEVSERWARNRAELLTAIEEDGA